MKKYLAIWKEKNKVCEVIKINFVEKFIVINDKHRIVTLKKGAYELLECLPKRDDHGKILHDKAVVCFSYYEDKELFIGEGHIEYSKDELCYMLITEKFSQKLSEVINKATFQKVGVLGVKK